MQKTYIGVYLKVAYSKCEQEIITLENSEGKVFKSGKFDPDTGEKLVEKVSKTYKWVKPDIDIDILEEHLDEDTFHSPLYIDSNTHAYFLINRNTRFSKYLGGYSTFNVSVDTIDIKEIIEEFKKKYSDYLHYYTTVRGYEVEVKWGVINYGN